MQLPALRLALPLTLRITASGCFFFPRLSLLQLLFATRPSTQVWGKVMGLDFFPIYCAIVVAFAAACQHLFLVREGGRAAAGRRAKGEHAGWHCRYACCAWCRWLCCMQLPRKIVSCFHRPGLLLS